MSAFPVDPPAGRRAARKGSVTSLKVATAMNKFKLHRHKGTAAGRRGR
jgi:hypothetical protein